MQVTTHLPAAQLWLTLDDCVSVKLQHYTARVCMYVCTQGWLLYNKVKAGNLN